MEILFFVLLFLIFILIIPIPIKINSNFKKGNLKFKIFNKEIKKKKTKVEKSEKDKGKSKTKTILTNPKFYKIFFRKLNNRKLKPKIKINGFINYSLGDACLTAISYGFISTISSFLYIFLNSIFKFKKSSLKINPLLQKEKNVGMNINCIIYISIGQIIHILLLLLLSIKKSKEVSHYRGNYE